MFAKIYKDFGLTSLILLLHASLVFTKMRVRRDIKLLPNTLDNNCFEKQVSIIIIIVTVFILFLFFET